MGPLATLLPAMGRAALPKDKTQGFQLRLPSVTSQQKLEAARGRTVTRWNWR
jgi:hypothetical protein